MPTGEPMRRVMLKVKARDGKNRPLPLLKGEKLPDWSGAGDSGRPGAVFARVLADDKGNLNVPSWQATRIAFDTRIRPKSTVSRTYEFALADPDDEPTVEAELVYRRAPQKLATAKGWKNGDMTIAAAAW